MNFPKQLTRATQQACYGIAQAYGFQVLNAAGEHEMSWVPATAGLAADQLSALLRDALARRAAVHGAQAQQQQQDAIATMDDDWQAAICDVHAEYFEEYYRWKGNLCLPHPEQQQQQQHQDAKGGQASRTTPRQLPDQQQVLQKLLELSLQFCIYTEAANLRHTPHMLFLIYYIMRSSSKFNQLLLEGYQPGQQLPHTHWLFWARLPAEDFPAAPIASLLQKQREKKQQQLLLQQQQGQKAGQQQEQEPHRGILPGACCITTLLCSLVQQLSDAVPDAFQGSAGQARESKQQAALEAAAEGMEASVQQHHKAWIGALLQDVCRPDWRQQQQTYLSVVVQPLFFFLAEQIDLAGQQAEEEPALRIAYDDVNESCCSPKAVYKLLDALKGQCSNNSTTGQQPAAAGQAPAEDLWQALQQVMEPPNVKPGKESSPPAWKRLFGGRKTELPENVKNRYPRDQKRLDILSQLDQIMPATPTPAAASSSSQPTSSLTINRNKLLVREATPLHEVYARAKHGADWWTANLFRHKTYVEARSVANPFIAFWRVYAFHAVLLTAMASLSFVWHERDVTAGFPWLKVVAALLLSTVTDAVMRMWRAAAHLVLLLYRIPVKRKVGQKWKSLNPFPPGGYSIAAGKVLLMLLWLAWTALLAVAVIPVMLGIPLAFSAGLDHLVQKRLLWLAPALVHAVLIWGRAVLCQRPGYTSSLWQDLTRKFTRPAKGSEGLDAALGKAGSTGGRAHCAADPAIDALFFPASNLVIDKSRWMRNAGLWVLVFVLKVAFELPLVVYPLVSLISEIVGGPNSFIDRALEVGWRSATASTIIEAVSHATVATALAVPVILLSFSDTGLIFSLVGAAVSALEGFSKGVGSIKNWSQMVSRFESLLQCYQQHCVSRSATLLHLHKLEELSVQEVSMSALAAGWNALALDLRERDLLNNQELAALSFEHLQLTESQKDDLRDVPHVRNLGLTSVLPARCFMAGAVPDLASGSAGSAHHLWVGRMAYGWLLWVVWQAGLLYNDNDVSQNESQAKANLQHLTKLRLLHPPRSREQIERWQAMLSEAIALLKLLSSSNTNPSNTPEAAAAVVRAQRLPAATSQAKPSGLLHGVPQDDKKKREVWRELSSRVYRLLELLDKELFQVEKLQGKSGITGPGASSSGGGLLSMLCGHREADMTSAESKEARKALEALRKRWEQLKDDAKRGLAPQQTQRFNMTPTQPQADQDKLRGQVLEHIALVGQVSEGPGQVCRWLTDVLTMFAGDTVPADAEATRFILDFASSLHDPGLGVAPSIDAMPSLTTLVPHYDEDVLYALSQGDAMQDLGVGDLSELERGSRSKMLYLMNDEGGATPTLAYLRSVYNTPGHARTQWANFVERVKDLAAAQGIRDVPKIVEEYHFLPGGPLHFLKLELLLWASWRGQLLARTVRGLMSYRAALEALAAYENPLLMPAAQQRQLDGLEEEEKRLVHQGQQLKQRLEKVKKLHLEELEKLQLDSTQIGQLQEAMKDAHKQELKVQDDKLEALKKDLLPLQQQRQHCDALRGMLLDDLVDSKYHLVVSSQNFGVFAQLASKESAKDMKAAWLVQSIHKLRSKHDRLKVAFIDKQELAAASVPGRKVELFRHASVLLASTRQQWLAAASGLPQQTEAYRVLLPINFESARGVVIGEGKPENQNHAVVFCPGEALQTIDCNQDNIVAEGLKLRNLLAELLPEGWDQPHPRSRPTISQMLRLGSLRLMGMHRSAAADTGPIGNMALLQQVPQGKGRIALVGFREWIFSEDSGALAEFAAATERSFGTTVQRLMHNPGACRFHYGHPDVWRRSFVSTCGGVSKANKGLHVSEDVFGGYNVILRGRDIKYVDYMAVGKGRDMGFETINTFEAKIAAGNGEQVLSRDVRRLAHNMDFTRLLSWYHTGNGFFINTAITMVNVHAGLWAYLLLALDKNTNPEVQKYLAAVQVLQLGTLSIGVYVFTLALQIGLLNSLFTIVRQMLQGSLMFYIFRAQTSAYNFTYDLLFGGAKYLPTGRGYKLAPTSFKDLYRRFGRSHFYFGAVLLVYAVACIAAGHMGGAQLLVLWAQFLVVVSLLYGPFWFTPFAFKTQLVSEEFDNLQQWFMSPSPEPANSWHAWNAESWRAAGNAAGKQMGRLGVCVRAHILKLPTLVMVLAAVARMKDGGSSGLPKWATALILAGGALWAFSMILVSRHIAARTALKSQMPRILNLTATVLLAGGIAVSGVLTSGANIRSLNTHSNIFLVFFGTVLLLRLLPLVYYSVLGRIEVLRDTTNGIYYLADVLLVYSLNGLRFVLSLFDIMTGLQAQLLFNTAYARQVMADANLESSKLLELISEALVLKRKQHALAAQRRQLALAANH